LLRQNWRGAWLQDLAHTQLEMFAVEQRGEASGPPLFFTANAVQNIGFALHELATNASKHAAFSAANGRVVVRWSGPTNNRILIQWSEHDGPTIDSPLRQGFGHQVLTDLVPKALQGQAKLDFCPEGLRWQLTIPASHTSSTIRTEAFS
jgi:two-component sensor histidine kinase